jgi:hypothetical protein
MDAKDLFNIDRRWKRKYAGRYADDIRQSQKYRVPRQPATQRHSQITKREK